MEVMDDWYNKTLNPGFNILDWQTPTCQNLIFINTLSPIPVHLHIVID